MRNIRHYQLLAARKTMDGGQTNVETFPGVL